MSEILACKMAAGLHTVYKGPTGMLQKLIFEKGSLCLFSFLVYSQNQKNWMNAILHTLDPAGSLQLKKQFELNFEAIFTWISSTWVNVAGIMHPLDENNAVNREPNQLPGFLFPSQIATRMLVETEDNANNRPHTLANLWSSHGTAISHAGPTGSSTCPHTIHFAFCNIRQIPLGSYLSDSSEERRITTTTHGIYNHQGKEADTI